MATYDITMKEYNGANYDALYPKTVSQQVLLNDEDVAEAIGLTMSNPTVLDAISKLTTTIGGKYTGTGEYGASHKTSLTFSFVPKLIIVSSETQYALFFYPWTYSKPMTADSYSPMTVEWDIVNKVVSWYSAGDANSQMNTNNKDYYYVAFS